MAVFCPELEGIDTFDTQMKIFSGRTIKPDITYHNSSCSDSEKSGVESAELMVETKVSQEDDLFKVSDTSYATMTEPDKHQDK